ncbi:MAG: phosphotransferase [Ilumatobacteraceae bacterium]
MDTVEPRDIADQVAMLLGPDSSNFLRAAVDAAGGQLISSRPRQIYQQPRAGVIASYDAKVCWGNNAATAETFAACTGDIPEDTLVVDDGADRVAVWRFPNDPDLPGLPSAFNEGSVERLLSELDLGSGAVRLAVRAYRPRRRAVVEAIGPSGRLFVKAVRPRRVEALHARHRLCVANEVPVPHSLGWNAKGLLVLQALPGATLREAIRSGKRAVPSGESIIGLLDRLPSELAAGPSRASWLERVHHYAAIVGSIMPTDAERARRIADAIREEAGVGPTVAVHGDLYESQLLVNGSNVSGLLDIDGAGPGDRLDDLGCMLGHLSVLAEVDRKHAGAIKALGADYLASFEKTVDPADLRYRTAAVVMSLVAGPHRVQDPRWPETTLRLIGLADQWLAAARKVRSPS